MIKSGQEQEVGLRKSTHISCFVSLEGNKSRGAGHGGQRLYVYEEGHGLEGWQSAFVTTPFWQHPDQAIMAERGPSRGSRTGRWHLCTHTRYVGTSSTILVPWVNANIKAATAAIVGQGSGSVGVGARGRGRERKRRQRDNMDLRRPTRSSHGRRAPHCLAEEPRAVRCVLSQRDTQT